MVKLIKPTQSINIKPTIKQDECWKYLMDDKHTIVFFGGAGGGGKSWIAVCWVVIMCLTNPGTRYAITRSRLVTLKKTTLVSLLNLMKEFGLEDNKQYTFDRSLNVITFYNNSQIILLDSFMYPSDMEYDRFGSYEFTGVVLDEASETSQKAFNVLQTRIRYKHQEYKLIPKFLIVSNPSNSFLKDQIYLPYINGTLPEHIAVVLSKATDNPYIDSSYIENLKTLDGATRARMLEGSWDYMDDSSAIFNSDKLVQMFYNTNFINSNNTKYLTCDIASSGSDKSCLCVWNGLELIDIHLLTHYTTPQLVDKIKNLMATYMIQVTNVIIDKQGVGVGTFDGVPGSIGFSANNKPTNPIYDMIKSECYYKLAEYVNNDKIYVSTKKFRDEMIQELSLHTMWDFDKDGKTKIIPKDKVKQSLGRSPDIADAIMLRMYFETKKSGFSFSFV